MQDFGILPDHALTRPRKGFITCIVDGVNARVYTAGEPFLGPKCMRAGQLSLSALRIIHDALGL